MKYQNRNRNNIKTKYIAHRRKKDGETQSLWLHLDEVSKKAGKFASKIGLSEQGEFIGLLHDIGKVSQEFQKYIKSAVGLIDSDDDNYVDSVKMKGKIDHSSAGAQLIYQKLSSKENEERCAAQILALCIASHHTGLIDCISPEGVDVYSKRMAKSDKKTHTEESYRNIDNTVRNHLCKMLRSKKLINNITNQYKSIREKKDSTETLIFKWGLMTRFLYSCLIDADRLSTADFELPAAAKLRNNGKYVAWEDLIERLNIKLNSYKEENRKEKNKKAKRINELRQKISQQCYDV